MKIFITGATGVLGRRVVRQLLKEDYEVVGLSRSKQNEEQLTAAGAEARSGDLFDPSSLKKVMEDCEMVLHLATRIPPGNKTGKKYWAINDRIRSEGTRNLLQAFNPDKTRHFITQSILFLYGDREGAWVDEQTPISQDLSDRYQSALDMENQLLKAMAAGHLSGRILRFGWFYSYDSEQTLSVIKMVGRRRFPLIGHGRYYLNFIHLDDAASAVVRSVEHWEKQENPILNICDGEPATMEAFLNFLAEKTEAKPPPRFPKWLARLMAGKDAVEFLTASAKCRNEKAKATLDWRPEYQDFRQGFEEVLSRIGP